MFQMERATMTLAIFLHFHLCLINYVKKAIITQSLLLLHLLLVMYLTGVHLLTEIGPWSETTLQFWPPFVTEFDTPALNRP